MSILIFRIAKIASRPSELAPARGYDPAPHRWLRLQTLADGARSVALRATELDVSTMARAARATRPGAATIVSVTPVILWHCKLGNGAIGINDNYRL